MTTFRVILRPFTFNLNTCTLSTCLFSPRILRRTGKLIVTCLPPPTLSPREKSEKAEMTWHKRDKIIRKWLFVSVDVSSAADQSETVSQLFLVGQARDEPLTLTSSWEATRNCFFYFYVVRHFRLSLLKKFIATFSIYMIL